MGKNTILIIVLIAAVVFFAIYKISEIEQTKAKNAYLASLASSSAVVASQKPTVVGLGAILQSLGNILPI